MPQAPVPTYRVQYEPSRGSWTLTGPVGAQGFLKYGTVAVMLCHTPGGMPVIPEERLRCSTSRGSFTGKFASKLMNLLTQHSFCRQLGEFFCDQFLTSFHLRNGAK